MSRLPQPEHPVVDHNSLDKDPLDGLDSKAAVETVEEPKYVREEPIVTRKVLLYNLDREDDIDERFQELWSYYRMYHAYSSGYKLINTLLAISILQR